MGKIISIFKLTHEEFYDVPEYSNTLLIMNNKNHKYDRLNNEFKLKNFRIVGTEISYTKAGNYNIRKARLNKNKFLQIISPTKFIFQLYVLDEVNDEQCWILKAPNEEQFIEWVTFIRKSYRPSWVEKSASECFICNQRFSFYKRQHHCRKCGIAICNECSGAREVLPNLAYNKPVRICSRCSSKETELINIPQHGKKDIFFAFPKTEESMTDSMLFPIPT